MNMDITKFFQGIQKNSSAPDTYSSTIDELEVKGFSNFYFLFVALLQLRSQDLQPLYPLYDENARRRFLGWIVMHGRREYKALHELKEFWNDLSKRACVRPTQWSMGITRRLQLAIESRTDLGIDSKLESEEEQRRALAWYWLQGGLKELGVTELDISSHEKVFWLDSCELRSSRFASLIYESRPDLQDLFNLNTSQGQFLYDQWIVNNGMIETSLPFLLSTAPRAWPASLSTRNKAQSLRGVNLIGYAFGELGIGEDVRMAAQALASADIPFCIINFQPGDDIRQADRSAEKWISEVPLYDTNIVCLTALEHFRFYLQHGAWIFEGRYTIGYWPWELHKWPEPWRHCFALADEIWASSRHIQRAAQAATHKPVRYMPMTVKLPDDFEACPNRARWGIPEEKYVFVFSFDGSSFIQRKNPEAILKAFNVAFSKNDDSVRLLIKCMRPDIHNPAWQRILEASKADRRIIIMDMMLTKGDVMSLYSSCNCFVSLHRAEGFGRGIAEAFLLGLDVIATKYGGNVDFCEKLTEFNVMYTIKQTVASDYVEGADNDWAEPDIHHAATCMAIAASSHAPASPNSNERALQLIELFSATAIGTRYKQYLDGLALLRDANSKRI